METPDQAAPAKADAVAEASVQEEPKAAEILDVVYSFSVDGHCTGLLYRGPLTPDTHAAVAALAREAREIGKGRR